MANFYVSQVSYTAVAQWQASHAYSSTSNGGRGDYVRQLTAPAAGNERVFRCTTAGTSNNTEPVWVLTRNATTADNQGTGSGVVVWTECTGQEADQAVGAWNAPHARIANAGASGWAAAGDNIFVSDSHAYSTSSAYSPAFQGTNTNLLKILCIKNALANIPPIDTDASTGASETTTGTSAYTATGSYYWEGINLNCGTGGSTASLNVGNTSSSVIYMKNCTLALLNTSGASQIKGNPNAGVNLNNVVLQFSGLAQGLLFGQGTWRNTPSALTGTVPTNLNAGAFSVFVIEGVDLSALNTGVASSSAWLPGSTLLLKDCKLNSGLTVTAPACPGAQCAVSRSDSAGTNYIEKLFQYQGSHVSDTTVARTGTVDPTPLSRKVVTTANCSYVNPFMLAPSIIKNTRAGTTIGITFFGIWFGSALPLNNELWMDVEYLGASGSPLGSVASGTVRNFLSSGVALTANTASAWDGQATVWAANTPVSVGTIRKSTGTAPGLLFQVTSISGSGTTGNSDPFSGATDGQSITDNAGVNQVVWQACWRFSQTLNFTPQQTGYVYAYIKAAKASSTYWIDPPIVQS